MEIKNLIERDFFGFAVLFQEPLSIWNVKCTTVLFGNMQIKIFAFFPHARWPFMKNLILSLCFSVIISVVTTDKNSCLV